MKIAIAYRYCKLDKEHEYFFEASEHEPAQLFWFGFHLAKRVRCKFKLYPYIPNWCKVKKLGNWSQASANDMAGFVGRAILKHIEERK